jgi:creatinine amidohydrolase
MVKHRLQDMTSAEFAERAREKPLVIIPMGAQETQGPHAPMGDFVLAGRLAELAAERSGAVVAPTLAYGDSEFLRTMPGTISIRPPTLIAVIEDICTNLIEQGLEHLLLFNGQTGNAPLLDQATRNIRRKHGAYVPFLNVWRILTPAQLKELYGDDLPGSQGHGGDPITSMFLHFYPDLLRMDLLARPKPFKSAFGLPTRSISSVGFRDVLVPMPFDVTQMVDNGNLSGDGSKASRERGADSAERIVAFTAAFIEHFRRQDPRDPLK